MSVPEETQGWEAVLGSELAAHQPEMENWYCSSWRESVDVMKLGSLQSSRAALCDQVNPESCLAQLTLETWKLEKGWMAVVRKETNGMLFAIEC